MKTDRSKRDKYKLVFLYTIVILIAILIYTVYVVLIEKRQLQGVEYVLFAIGSIIMGLKLIFDLKSGN